MTETADWSTIWPNPNVAQSFLFLTKEGATHTIVWKIYFWSFQSHKEDSCSDKKQQDAKKSLVTLCFILIITVILLLMIIIDIAYRKTHPDYNKTIYHVVIFLWILFIYTPSKPSWPIGQVIIFFFPAQIAGVEMGSNLNKKMWNLVKISIFFWQNPVSGPHKRHDGGWNCLIIQQKNVKYCQIWSNIVENLVKNQAFFREIYSKI